MNYQIIKTADELRRAIETIATQPVVGLDTETTDLDPFTARLRLIQLATPDRVFIIDFDPASGALKLDERFRDAGAARPGVSFNQKAWPHGFTGKAVPHGTVFSR